MIVVSKSEGRCLNEVSAFFEEHEALWAIEVLANMLSVAKFMSFELDQRASKFSISVIHPDILHTVPEELQGVIRAYFAGKSG